MPRQTDYSQIPTDKRIFVKTQEWDFDESRTFFNTGYEKVEKISQKTGRAYCQYYYYLIPAGEEFEPELTLGLFSGQAAELKKSTMYQKVTITKLNGERGEDWVAVLHDEFMPEKQRPALSDYPEVKEYVSVADPVAKSEVKPVPRHGEEEEINIDDIPF